MPTFRSFLGEAALPHYAVVAEIVADRLGERRSAVIQTDLADLDRVVAERSPTVAFLCGLPFVRLRDRHAPVEAVAAPVPEPADHGPSYFTVLVARPDLGRPVPGTRIAFNNRDSLSGWVLPRAGLAASAIDPDTMDWRETGSHRASLALLLNGGVDVAGIDSTVLDLEARRNRSVASLTVIARYGPMPAPPIVVWGGGAAFAELVRAAAVSLVGSAAGRRALAAGRVARFVPVTAADYAPVRAADRALGRGSTR